jgi:DnaJ-class molecular chaperone
MQAEKPNKTKFKTMSSVTEDGRILKNISNEREVICPTCKGKGTVNNPKLRGKPMSYCDKNGNSFPQVDCRTCNGEGWVLIISNQQS